jgi:YegS/Rv2252/BmrU family lipid kinase
VPEIRPFVLVVNPRAGAGRAGQQLDALTAALREGGARFDVVQTRGPGDATVRVREALDAGAEGIAVVGGDGTLNEAVNGFFEPDGTARDTEAWLGPLPCGTGGDFRKSVGIGTDMNATVTRMLWATPRPIDVGWLEFRDHEGKKAARAFLNIASFGLGGLVDQIVNAGPKWIGGKPAFFLGTLRAMRRYSNRKVVITVDDEPPRETEIVNVAVANGQYFGGGMHIAPEAVLDDGLFDVVGLENMGRVEQMRLTRHLYGDTILQQPKVTYARGRRIVAEPADWSGPVLLDVDGEAPGALPATFEVRPGAVRLRA